MVLWPLGHCALLSNVRFLPTDEAMAGAAGLWSVHKSISLLLIESSSSLSRNSVGRNSEVFYSTNNSD